jgi:hypothetical protein
VTHADEFPGGEDERSRLLRETEHDSVALVSAGAEAVRLETMLERADREVTGREADTAALVIAQMRELVNGGGGPAALSLSASGAANWASSWKLLGNRSPHATPHSRLHTTREKPAFAA